MKPLPDQAALWTLLYYEAETGLLFWRARAAFWFSSARDCKRWNSTYAGKEALTALDSRGYKRGAILKGRYHAHRVIWKYMTGRDPEADIDHIDGDRLNNRYENLRECTRQVNARNQRLRRNNTSGRIGVDYNKQAKRWRAQISDGQKNLNLGNFATIEEAVAARIGAEKALGYHPNHGRIR